jgi:hypothetical protein
MSIISLEGNEARSDEQTCMQTDGQPCHACNLTDRPEQMQTRHHACMRAARHVCMLTDIQEIYELMQTCSMQVIHAYAAHADTLRKTAELETGRKDGQTDRHTSINKTLAACLYMYIYDSHVNRSMQTNMQACSHGNFNN